MILEHSSNDSTRTAPMLRIVVACCLIGCSSETESSMNMTDAGTASGGEAPSSDGTSADGGGPTAGSGPGSASAADSGNGPGGDTADTADTADTGGGNGDGDGLGPPEYDDDELDPPSHGGTITFQEIGAPGWYPSRRDPAVGPCDAYDANGCCMARKEVTSDQMTPWDEDLVMTLRGPMLVKQFAVYHPEGDAADDWTLVSGWTENASSSPQGVAFHGNGAESGFTGAVGTECLVDVTSDRPFGCGDGSDPFCPESANPQHFGWDGSKLFVLLAAMPHVDQQDVGVACSDNNSGNWWDAPWIGLSLGELTRAGAFSDCQCYAKSPDEWWLGDGCGQFNVFEVVNDNNDFRNLDIFSTNFFGYAGYVGEGPCGADCDVSSLGPEVDLIDKASVSEAAEGVEASPSQSSGTAFLRPSTGYRYFIILMDANARTIQLGIVHPSQIPASIDTLLPNLPFTLPRTAVDAVLDLRLPQ